MSELSVTTLKHESATSDNIRLASNGNVGIGTSSPNFPLSFGANLNKTIAVFENAGADVYGIGMGGNGSAGDPYRTKIFANGFEYLSVDYAGRVTMPYQPMFFGRGMPGAATAVGSFTPCTFSVSQNTGGHWNNSTGTFTVPISGNYLLLWTVGNQGAGNNGQYIGIYILINNTTFLSGWSLSTGYDSTAHCGGVVPLVAGDSIRFAYITDYGVPPNTDQFTHATCYLIG